jgi:type IV fimbrial biogenesis protein FimT
MGHDHFSLRGFTLIEALVVIAIVAILQSIAAPAFSALAHRSQLDSVADSLHMHMLLTRNEAILRNGRLVMCKSASGRDCSPTGGWEQGWIVFHDSNENGVVDRTESLVAQVHALPSTVRVLGNVQVSSYVSYQPSGRSSLITGAFQAGTLTVCVLSDKPAEARQLVISSSGRVRAQRTKVAVC